MERSRRFRRGFPPPELAFVVMPFIPTPPQLFFFPSKVTHLHHLRHCYQGDAEPAKWSAAGWIISQGFIPTELAKALLPDGDGTELDKMRGLAAELGSEDVLEECLKGACKDIAKNLWAELQKLATGGDTGGGTNTLRSKFEGKLELNYGGLDTFFGV